MGLGAASDFKTWNYIGFNALNKGDKEMAQFSMESAVNLWTTKDSKKELSLTYSELGVLYLDKKQNDQALMAFKNAVQYYPKYGHTWFRLGLMYTSLGKSSEAIESYEKAIQYDPQLKPAYSTLGDLYKRTRHFDKGVIVYKKLVKLNPTSDSAFQGLGECQRHSGDLNGAIKSLTESIHLNSNNAISHFNLGLCYTDQGAYDKSITEFQSALDAIVLIPDAFKIQIITYLGQSYEKTGQTQKAKECYQKAKKMLDQIPGTK